MKHTLAIKYLSFVFLSLMLSITFPACHTSEPLENKTKLTKEEKTIIAMKKKDDAKARKEYEKAVKAHRKNQADNTKQMMKDAKRQQRKNNRIHKRSLWDRLFRNKCDLK